MEDKQTVRVTILSRPYTLRVAGDSREVEAVADGLEHMLAGLVREPDDQVGAHDDALAFRLQHRGGELRNQHPANGAGRAADADD